MNVLDIQIMINVFFMFSVSVEAIHVANMLYDHGFYFSIDSKEPSVRDDGSFFRFQVRTC